MHIQPVASLEELQRLAASWNALTREVPFRSWEWLGSWWQHYGEPLVTSGRRELFVLAVRDDSGSVVGIAPWYLERSRTLGRIIRFLGSGEVCSDYLSVLCRQEDEGAVSSAIARWLSTEVGSWDLLQLAGVDAADDPVLRLLEALQSSGNTVQHCEAPRCWRAALPSDWEEYLATLSKSHRKQIRRLERGDLDNGAVTVRTAQTPDDVSRGIRILIDLHQRRRQSLGEPGCFSSEAFEKFHRQAIPQLFAAGQLRLTWLEADGSPIAAEYHLAGGKIIYAYQAGLDPDRLDHEPGRLAAIATIRAAIAEGATAIDFLRGDEPYKAHWRAEPRPTIDVNVVPSRSGARLRHGMVNAGSSVKDWLKAGLELTGIRTQD